MRTSLGRRAGVRRRKISGSCARSTSRAIRAGARPTANRWASSSRCGLGSTKGRSDTKRDEIRRAGNGPLAPSGRPVPGRRMVRRLNHRRRWSRRFDMEDREIRAALDRHWAASDANDFEAEHQIYQEDAVLEYPQSGERIRGRLKIQSSRAAQPNRKRFTVRRIIGAGDLWVTEFVLSYDGRPSYTVSIMELLDGKVARETQYFGDPFEPGPSRAQWVERMP